MPSKSVTVLVVLSVALAAVAIFTAVRPAAALPDTPGGQFHVVANNDALILYDTSGRQSWILTPQPKQKRHAWVPIKRLDSEAEVRTWELQHGPTKE